MLYVILNICTVKIIASLVGASILMLYNDDSLIDKFVISLLLQLLCYVMYLMFFITPDENGSIRKCIKGRFFHSSLLL